MGRLTERFCLIYAVVGLCILSAVRIFNELHAHRIKLWTKKTTERIRFVMGKKLVFKIIRSNRGVVTEGILYTFTILSIVFVFNRFFFNR